MKQKKNQHYTIIKIERLNQKIKGSRTKVKVKELLGSIYREDLRNGQIEIIYNGELLKFNNPEIYEDIYADGTKERWIKQIEFNLEHEGLLLGVKGFIAIRIPASVKEAGFTLIRRGRVIIGGPEKIIVPLSYLVNQIRTPIKDCLENCIWMIGLSHRQRMTLTGTIAG